MADCGPLTVEPAFDPANVSVDCNLQTAQTTPGGTATVSVTISNQNEQPANVDVAVEAAGPSNEVLRSDSNVEVAGTGTRTKTYTVTVPSTSGDYTITASISGVASAAAPRAARPAGVSARSPASAIFNCSGCERRSKRMTQEYRRITGRARQIVPGR